MMSRVSLRSYLKNWVGFYTFFIKKVRSGEWRRVTRQRIFAINLFGQSSKSVLSEKEVVPMMQSYLFQVSVAVAAGLVVLLISRMIK